MPRLAARVAMGPLAVVTLLGAAASMALLVVPYDLHLPGSLAIAVALGALASVCLALSLSAVAALLSAAAPADRQGTVLGNNAALIVLGEVIGVTGGSLLAGINPAVPIVVYAILAALAPVALGLRPSRPATVGTGP